MDRPTQASNLLLIYDLSKFYIENVLKKKLA